MRVSPRQGSPEVTALREAKSGRVRMHIAGVTYRMEAQEAIDLANQLVDVVQELKNSDRKE